VCVRKRERESKSESQKESKSKRESKSNGRGDTERERERERERVTTPIFSASPEQLTFAKLVSSWWLLSTLTFTTTRSGQG